MTISPQQRMRSYIQLVATGPELSKSLTAAQCEDGLTSILNGEIDPVQSGIFLIALRMKRETDDENSGALQALMKQTKHCVVEKPEILAIADPFNGYNRGLPATAFLPPVLAALGIPTYCHGLKEAGPKYGLTLNLILEACGKAVDLHIDQAAVRLADDDIGWAYIDQSVYAPSLHDLVPLRDQMVKRCCLSTLEVVLKPLSGQQKTHLMTGFVHKAYPPVYAALAREVGYSSAMIIRGVEGGSIPSLSQVARYFSSGPNAELQLHKLSPEDFGIEQSERSIALDKKYQSIAEQSTLGNSNQWQPVLDELAQLGLDALSAKPGAMYDSLVYGGGIALAQLRGIESFADAADQVRNVLDNGTALSRFNNG